MKTFLILLLWGASAFAYPTAGDHIGLSSEVGKGTMTIEYWNRGFNSLKNVWNVDFKSTFNGAIQSQGSQEFLPDDMVTSAGMQALIANCHNVGGSQETLTLKPGTFVTCHIQSSSGNDTWFGDVPFGIVAFTTETKGQKYKFELTILELGRK